MRRSRLGRRISRRLSLVSRVPGIIGTRIRQEFGSRDSLAPRRIEITVIAPDKTQRNLCCETGCTVCELLAPICKEFSLQGWPLVRLAGSQAEVDPEACAALLEAEIVIVDPRPVPDKSEGARSLSVEWEREERTYISRLRSALPLYGTPLCQVGIFTPCEFSSVFGPLQALADHCQAAADQIKEIIDHWDEGDKKIGSAFSPQFWEQYALYQEIYRKSKQLLREKAKQEEDFEELCRLRRGAAKFGLHQLLDLPVCCENVLLPSLIFKTLQV